MSGRNALTAQLTTLLVLSLCACSSPRREETTEASATAASPRASEAAPRAGVPAGLWTDAFTQRQVLIGAEIRIEGPKGLMNHLATASDAEEFDRLEKTLPEGFLLDISIKPEIVSGEIKAQLDALAIVATRRLVVLERPGPVDVLVLAQGDAYWRNPVTEEEQRGETLRFSGTIPR